MNNVEDIKKEGLMSKGVVKNSFRTPATKCQHPQKRTDINSSRGYRFFRCGSSIWSYCSYCASKNQKEKFDIVASGSIPEDSGNDKLFNEYDFYALTLTAPSFGKVHTVSFEDSMVKCACGAFHFPGDPLIGAPVDSLLYRYKEQVEWNNASSDLLKRTMAYFGDKIGNNFEYVVAREWQARGVLHYHFLIRVPKEVNGETIPEARVLRNLKRCKLYHFGNFKWGRASYFEKITPNKVINVIYYITKGVNKTARQQGAKYGLLSDALVAHYDKLDKWAHRVPCVKGVKCLGEDCKTKSHGNFGWYGHLITTSNNWSITNLTVKKLKENRAQWVADAIADGTLTDDGSYEKDLEDTFHKAQKSFEEEFPVTNEINEERLQRLFDSFGL